MLTNIIHLKQVLLSDRLTFSKYENGTKIYYDEQKLKRDELSTIYGFNTCFFLSKWRILKLSVLPLKANLSLQHKIRRHTFTPEKG
jgi:hypothetical protein